MPLRDHVANFELPDAVLERHANARRLIETLRVGLESLAHAVAKAESDVAAAHAAEMAERPPLANVQPQDVAIVEFGNLTGLDGPRQSFLECCFHWYSVSACNVVELIGGIHRAHNPQAPSVRDYVESVLPIVLPWRNKIGAHPVEFRTDGRDNSAERSISTMSPLGYKDGRLMAQQFTLYVRRGGNASQSDALQPWSLTDVHAGLCQRYAPRPAPTDATPGPQSGEQA